YSSVVGQKSDCRHTEDTDGFQVTSERERYLNRLKACSLPSNPGSVSTTGSSCGMSAKARFTGRSSRKGESPKRPGMRFVAMLTLSMAAKLSPCLGPEQVAPVVWWARKGSVPAPQ